MSQFSHNQNESTMTPNRRHFLLAGAALTLPAWARAQTPLPKLKKAVKLGMVDVKGGYEAKLALCKKVGFAGVEIDIPGTPDLPKLVAASQSTGVKVHGVICSTHWGSPLSAADAATRAVTASAMAEAFVAAKTVGADTVLVVPGVVNKKVSYDECWARSTEEIKKLIPLADAQGVKIAVEVVWNNFITKPEQLVKYVDQFGTPTVGAYFDASNMLRYGTPSATWIRALGKRMLKLDFKGYSNAKAKAENNVGKGFNVGIGEGDEDWHAVLKACAEVGYTGWATAEVGGGGEEWLRDVSKRMDKILEL